MTDWFRVPCLTDEAVAGFETKLRRARSSRHEYMRIQALALRDAGDNAAAVRMLDRIISENGDHALLGWLLEWKADCLRSLGDEAGAMAAYRAAIDRMRSKPNARGEAPAKFCLWIGEARLRDQYDDALAVAAAFFEDRPIFPLTEFRQTAALALIEYDMGDISKALAFARKALAAANRRASDAAKHPMLGLVGDSHPTLRQRLAQIIQSSDTLAQAKE